MWTLSPGCKFPIESSWAPETVAFKGSPEATVHSTVNSSSPGTSDQVMLRLVVLTSVTVMAPPLSPALENWKNYCVRTLSGINCRLLFGTYFLKALLFNFTHCDLYDIHVFHLDLLFGQLYFIHKLKKSWYHHGFVDLSGIANIIKCSYQETLHSWILRTSHEIAFLFTGWSCRRQPLSSDLV